MAAKYTVKEFNAKKAEQGHSCLVVTSETTSGSEVTPGSGDCTGVGVCQRDTASGKFFIKIKSVNYKFNDDGNPLNEEAAGKKLTLGEIIQNTTNEGSAIVNDGTYVTTRSGDAESGYEYSTTQDLSQDKVLITNLSARDQFAVQALRGMLQHIDDPQSVSENEMGMYCDIAYEWASVMIAAAAKVRDVVKDEESPSGEEEEEIGILDTNTEKILYNILVTLKKSNGEGSVMEQIAETLVGVKEALTDINTTLEDINTTLQGGEEADEEEVAEE